MSNCQPNCGCKFEVDSSCVRYTGINLGTTSINTGDTVETTIIKIDEAINNLLQTFESGQAPSIEGPTNKVVKFGPPNTPLLPSQTYDDGLSIGINASADPAFKMSVETSTNQGGLKVASLNSGKDAIVAKNEAVGALINKGVVSLVSGSSVSNIGIELSATGTSNINVGISASAFGGTANYSAQLKDGSETAQGGKFLKDTGSGKANWSYINIADIQDYQAPTPFVLQPATSSVLGGVKIGSGISVAIDGTISVPTPTAYSLPTASSTVLGGIKVGNGLAINGQGVLSANIGQGTLNYVAKFTPNGYSIDDSLIQDNGTNVYIDGALTTQQAESKFLVSSNDTDKGLQVLVAGSNNNSPIGIVSNLSITANTKSGEVVGGQFTARGSSTKNVGVQGLSNQASNGVNVGLFSEALNGVLGNYSIQLKDGTQTSGGGKFLRDMGDGKANWADINPQKTISGNYTLTAADNGYSILVLNAATAVTITIPSGLPASMQVGFIQDGTGDVTFAGSTLNCAVIGATKIKGQYDQAYLEKKGANEVYYLLGNVKV